MFAKLMVEKTAVPFFFFFFCREQRRTGVQVNGPELSRAADRNRGSLKACGLSRLGGDV